MSVLKIIIKEIEKTEKKLAFYEAVGIFNKKDELETLKNLIYVRDSLKLILKG